VFYGLPNDFKRTLSNSILSSWTSPAGNLKEQKKRTVVFEVSYLMGKSVQGTLNARKQTLWVTLYIIDFLLLHVYSERSNSWNVRIYISFRISAKSEAKTYIFTFSGKSAKMKYLLF